MKAPALLEGHRNDSTEARIRDPYQTLIISRFDAVAPQRIARLLSSVSRFATKTQGLNTSFLVLALAVLLMAMCFTYHHA